MSDNSLIDYSENSDHQEQLSSMSESENDSNNSTENKKPKKNKKQILGNQKFKEDSGPQILPDKSKKDLKKDAETYLKNQKRKGVVYIPRVPRFMNVAMIREYFQKFKVERVYLTPESDKERKSRVSTGGSKRRLYKDGWVEFRDKRVARMVAVTFNGRQVGSKKTSYNYYDLWSIKYLPKFKWDNLTERIEYDRRVRAAKFNQKIVKSRKEHDFIIGKIDTAKNNQQTLRRQVKFLEFLNFFLDLLR